jgi:histidyl-tRNA synthetase
MRFQAPRGTEDVLPSDAPKWLHLENTFRAVAREYGYKEIRTPIFEDTDLFTRSAGETSDIVSKEMYTFEDKGGRSVTLKPEGTAPVMRAVIEHNLCPPGTTTRLMYLTHCFRYNRPGKGRLRELHQVGCELIGSASPAADAEIIELIFRFFERLGLGRQTVLLNSIGRTDCRERYRDAILTHLASYLAEQTEEILLAAHKNPLRLLDTKDPGLLAALVGVPPITDYLEPESAANFETLQQLLGDAGVPFEVRPDIVRGLDYYTETVFEFQPKELGGQSSCGGGRYDKLVEQLGGGSVPSVGFGIGVERTLLTMAANGIEPPAEKLDVFIVQASPGTYRLSLEIARNLRSVGLSALTDLDGRSMKSQLRQADKSGARFAVVLGENELASGTAQLKDLVSGVQIEVAQSELSGRVRME